MDERLVVVYTEVRAQYHAFYWLDVYVGITEHTPDLQAVVAVVIQLAQRILTVTHTAYRTTEGLVVLFIYRNRRSHLEGILHWEAVHLVGVAYSEVLTNSDKLVHVVAGIDTAREVLEVGIFQNTGVLLVAQRHEGRVLVGGV